MSGDALLQKKLQKRLEAILKLPDNLVCADCRRRGPRWASANLGVFMCIECSGIHRNLGVHISFVRSVNLDTWTQKQVDFMEEWGNGRANSFFEAELPSHVVRPKEGDTVRTTEKFIRDKYEHRRYCGKSVPPKTLYEEEAEEDEPVARRRGSSKPSVSRPNVSISRPGFVAAPIVSSRAVDNTPNLLDFMDSEPEPVQSIFTAPQAQQQQQQQFVAPAAQHIQQSQQNFGFINPVSSSAAPLQPGFNSEDFSSTFLQPAASVPAKATANDILSMFNSGPPQQPQQQQQYVHQQVGYGRAPNVPGQPMGIPQQMPGMQGYHPNQAMGGYGNQVGQMQQGITGGGYHQQQMAGYPQHMGVPQGIAPQMNHPYGYPQQQMSQQPMQQQMGSYGQQQMMMGAGPSGVGMTGMVNGYPQQAPPPIPQQPPQNSFDFGSPNTMQNGFRR